MSAVSLVLAGLGGMGTCFLQALLEKEDARLFRLAGAVDPHPERCSLLDELQKRRIPVYGSLEKFFSVSNAELAVISSPIHLHARQTLTALSGGSHVLCEKPAAATIQDIRRMIRSRNRHGRFVAVGFQWSFSPSIRKLKADILKGDFGKPRRFRCLVLWPRDEAYYLRNDWAGRLRSRQREWILDSPVNNAMAHDLHNMLFLLGRKPDLSAAPLEITAETYRATPIESYDTAALRLVTAGGVEVLFFVSHACEAERGPLFTYEFERGIVFGWGRRASVRALFGDGRTRDYGCPDEESLRKLWDSIRAVRSGEATACGLEAASGHTLAVNGVQESRPRPVEIPRGFLDIKGPPGQRKFRIRGVEGILGRCYEENLLPSELGITWAKSGRRVRLGKYTFFPGGKKPV